MRVVAALLLLAQLVSAADKPKQQHRVKLNWQGPTMKYKVYRANGSCDNVTWKQLLGVTTDTKFVDEQVEAGKHYCYMVEYGDPEFGDGGRLAIEATVPKD